MINDVYLVVRLLSWNEARQTCEKQNMSLSIFNMEIYDEFSRRLSTSVHESEDVMFIGLKRNVKVVYFYLFLPSINTIIFTLTLISYFEN